MREAIGGMSPNQSTLIKYNAGKDLAEKIDQAWKLIFKYENFHPKADGSMTNRRSELNDRLDTVRFWTNDKWPTYINTGSAGSSAMTYVPGFGPFGGVNGMVGALVPPQHPLLMNSYVDMFDTPPWYKRWYKTCKDATLALWVYLTWVYKTGKWGLP